MKEEITYNHVKVNNDYEDFFAGVKAVFDKYKNPKPLNIRSSVYPDKPCKNFNDWTDYIFNRLKF